jgi:hypothetical protein
VFVYPAILYFFLSKLFRQFCNISEYVTVRHLQKYRNTVPPPELQKLLCTISQAILHYGSISVSHYNVRLVYLLLFCFTSTWLEYCTRSSWSCLLLPEYKPVYCPPSQLICFFASGASQKSCWPCWNVYCTKSHLFRAYFYEKWYSILKKCRPIGVNAPKFGRRFLFFIMCKFETEHFKPVYFRGKKNIFADLQNFKPVQKMGPRKLQKRLSPLIENSKIATFLQKVCNFWKSANLRVCDLRNLLADWPTFKTYKNVFLPYFDWNDGGVSWLRYMTIFCVLSETEQIWIQWGFF